MFANIGENLMDKTADQRSVGIYPGNQLWDNLEKSSISCCQLSNKYLFQYCRKDLSIHEGEAVCNNNKRRNTREVTVTYFIL